MPQTPADSGSSNHGNKYLTAVLLLVLVVGLFVATMTHLVF